MNEELFRRALDARNNSYSPYSGFKVGACLEAEDGTFFDGCNIESASYGASICAERTALVKAVSQGVTKFTRIAVACSGPDFAWPCGICRQLLYEFAPQLEVYAVKENGESECVSLSGLLPNAFGPESL